MAQLNLKTRMLEASIGVLAVPSEAAATALRALETRWREAHPDAPGRIVSLHRADPDGEPESGAPSSAEDVVGFDYLPPPERRFARRDDEPSDLRACELRVRLRAPNERADAGSARRVAERADGVLVLVDPGAPRADVEQLLTELGRGEGRDLPVITWSEGVEDEVLDVVERLVRRALEQPILPASDRVAKSTEGARHPLLDSLRALLVEVTDDHLRRIESSLGEQLTTRVDARFAEVADGKRLAEVDKRLARLAAEVTGRTSAESKWRADESARGVATAERVTAVERALGELRPDVSEMSAGMGELSAAMTTIGGTLATLVHAVEAAATRGEARARRLDAIATVLSAQGQAMRDLDERMAELSKRISKVEEQVRGARSDLGDTRARTEAMSTASTEALDRIEEGVDELRRDPAPPDPRTVELLREVTELCEEIKKKKKGWFG